MERLDKLLVDRGLVDTRSKAQQLIEEGVVLVDGIVVSKASLRTDSEDIVVNKKNIYVGRGAHKIEGALEDFQVDPAGMIVADVGASTGGFTEFVLEKGASKVFAIDVGHDQLAPKLREDDRVVNMEGTNIRELDSMNGTCDLAVVDLSFISLKLVLENILALLKDSGEAIVLIKPQFEVGKKNLNKQGVCKDQKVIEDTILDLYRWSNTMNYFIKGFSFCHIKGKTGNQEYFFHYDRKLSTHGITEMDLLNILENGQ
ncbi:TlyA family RNA methyltransferase [Bacteriovorax sp. Seq25_V]|uniref:TlyA family RNA methyltransferase n=1 Tax=Bacteriovorax sp. Seq25_V TaxID=1201288 RepID=UPI00038A0851|nr:TlyA family RNA methyltransferase [Bacteriovorax sp. Seq25_V]EQC47274.1 ribosomal RNA large subunit methyltransferase J [Bacteriovorax sp. Seq25_V]